jgi:prepilin-type N-terminal cleavage/methylation domain-containing protein
MKPKESNTGRASGSPGFTLIELMVAMTVLAIGLFAIIHMQVVTVRGHSYARERTQAYEIAMGVAEELRTWGHGWVELPDGSGYDFKKTFTVDNPALSTGLIKSTLAALPSEGDQLAYASLNSLESYRGFKVSPDGTRATARLINVFGKGPQVDGVSAVELESCAAIYRVHYVAHPVRLQPGGGGSTDLVRVTVFVSWDNKDHGDRSYDWSQWGGTSGTYFNRNMVAVTFYLGRHYFL